MRKPTFTTDANLGEMTTVSQNLEVCGETRMERVRKLLSSPLARRKSNIMHPRTFGVPLENLIQQSAVPFVVVRLCKYIEKHGMTQEGLFRIGGNVRLIEKLKTSFDNSGDAALDTEADVASAAGLLKLFFRELPEPLIPTSMHSEFLDAIQATAHDKEECIRCLKCLVEHLPPENFNVLKYLSHFLYKVSQLEEHTRMNPGALGIVFGPNLFRFTENLQGLKEQAVTNQVVACFIADYPSIFEGDAELSCPNEANSKSGCSRRMQNLGSFPLEPLSVLIPPLDEPILTMKQTSMNEVPTLMIESLMEGTRNQDGSYTSFALSEMKENTQITPVRSCKRKERKLSGEDPQQARSSSEERPSGGALEPLLLIRRCSSHEEMTAVVGSDGKYQAVKSLANASVDVTRDLSPHPPQPKRREIETASPPMKEFHDMHEVQRSAERLAPHQYTLYQSAFHKSGGNSQLIEGSFQASHLYSHKSDMKHEETVYQKMDIYHKMEEGPPPTPPVLNKDNIPPLDFSSLHEEEPVLSEHRFSWPMVQAHVEEEGASSTPYLRKANSYEAPLSPSAFRSYLSHRSLHLDPNLPPSPPVEQEDFPKSIKEETASVTSVKQLSKKIHSIKKKIKQFEEEFEVEHGYRPSHAEKMNYQSIKKMLLDLNKLRKELKTLKEDSNLPEPAYLNMASWARDRYTHDDSDDSKQPSVLEGALNETLITLAEKRRHCHRPDSVAEMTRDQVQDEKIAIQKALLKFESIHGRPSSKADRNLMRPLYDRYRSVKRIIGRGGQFSSKGKEPGTELQPILEHVAMDFTSPQPRSPPPEPETAPNEPIETPSQVPEQKAQTEPESTSPEKKADKKGSSPVRLAKYSNSNLHELPLSELLHQQHHARIEKRRLRRVLREFEEEFQKLMGRKVQKEDKIPMEAAYNEYKHIKARLRLLEALVSKHDQHSEV